MNGRLPAEAAVADTERELTPMERREIVIGQLIMEYSDIIQDGRYDMAFNRLSRHLYQLRSIQYELEREQDGDGR